MSPVRWETRANLREAIVALQPCKEKIEIKPKSDYSFTAT